MPQDPKDPTNLVLEQLRLMRADISARFDRVDERFEKVEQRFERLEQKVSNIEKELRGLKLNTIAEVYKANLTVASFADHERRIQDLERRQH